MKKLLSAAIAVIAVASIAGPVGAASNDPYFARQWGLQKIQAEQAWATATGTGAVVAVVDSGVDLGHPDLAANLLTATDADFVEPDGNCTGPKHSRTCAQDGPQDENGHGTHVAGIIAAATNNGTGVAGVAPNAKLLPVRVLDENGDGTGDVVAGIRYAADHGADVINMSLGYLSGVGEALGTIGDLDELYAALDYAWERGSVVVVAAGNDTAPICAEPASGHHVICVGSTTSADLISYFSNFDAALIDTYLVAPGGDGMAGFSLGPSSPTAPLCGGDVFSTYLRSERSWCSSEAGYEAIAGTSMAAPHVSGVAALLASKGLTNQQIVDCLTRTSDDLGAPGRDSIYGYGRVNALKAVTGC